jgi:hypothetical protein
MHSFQVWHGAFFFVTSGNARLVSILGYILRHHHIVSIRNLIYRFFFLCGFTVDGHLLRNKFHIAFIANQYPHHLLYFGTQLTDLRHVPVIFSPLSMLCLTNIHPFPIFHGTESFNEHLGYSSSAIHQCDTQVTERRHMRA